MENANILLSVIQQLRGLFLEKHELRGYDDWDSFFGCINAIEQVAIALSATQEENTAEE